MRNVTRAEHDILCAALLDSVAVVKVLERPMTDKTTVDELLPCPFCGERPIFGADKRFQYDLSCENVKCPVCSTTDAQSNEDAIKQWNKRTPTPPSDALRAAMEALRIGGNPTNNTIDDAYIGRMFDNCNAVLAAWDAQQGDGM